MVGGQSKKGRNKGKRKRRTIVHIEERKTTRGGGVFPATSRDWGGGDYIALATMKHQYMQVSTTDYQFPQMREEKYITSPFPFSVPFFLSFSFFIRRSQQSRASPLATTPWSKSTSMRLAQYHPAAHTYPYKINDGLLSREW